MARLRELFEELGFTDVATFIASGNVIFSTASEEPDDLTHVIEQHLVRSLGYGVATFLRSPDDLEAIARFETGAGTQGPVPASHYVMFLRGPASDSMRSQFADLCSEMDDFQFSGAEIHWLIQGKMSESPLFKGGLERATQGATTTTRNMNTVRRLVAKTTRAEAT